MITVVLDTDNTGGVILDYVASPGVALDPNTRLTILFDFMATPYVASPWTDFATGWIDVPPTIPNGALLLPGSDFALLLPDGSSYFLRP